MAFLTGNPAQDLAYLDQLDDDQLMMVFRSNDKYNTTNFWTRRLEVKFPGALKFTGLMDIREFYVRLSLFATPFTKENIVALISNNEINVLKYIYFQNEFIIDNIYINAATAVGNLAILSWLQEAALNNATPKDSVMKVTSKSPRHKKVVTPVSSLLPIPDQNAINMAARNNQFAFVRHMYEQYEMLPSIFAAVLSNNMELVDFVVGNNNFNDNDMKYIDLTILDKISVPMFKYLLDENFRIEKIAADIAASYGRLEIVKLLYSERGIKPTVAAVRKAQLDGYFIIVAWCADHFIFDV